MLYYKSDFPHIHLNSTDLPDCNEVTLGLVCNGIYSLYTIFDGYMLITDDRRYYKLNNLGLIVEEVKVLERRYLTSMVHIKIDN